MRGLIVRTRALWNDSRGLRFLAVGVWNTLFGYGCFAGLYALAGTRLHYMAIQVIAHFAAVANAFVWHRTLTFRSQAPWPMEFLRFNAGYLGTLALGLALLPALVGGAGMHPLAAAAVVTAITVAVSYVVHAGFSFRDRGRPRGE